MTHTINPTPATRHGGLQFTRGDQSVTLRCAAYRRGGGESTQ